ncbi:MAG: 6-pyruvoyl-tetrahydropterin synthase-related protein, partial [bacterium]|nr:6-pyruvoyl-tetrahydropterin synthase-related protein [bacterium]
PEIALKLSFSFTYLLAGVGMYLFAQTYFKNEKIALFSALMYQFAPFRLVDMLIRGNIGSLYSYMSAPFVLYFITKYLQKKSYFAFVGISVFIALLALGHTINGYIFIGLSGLFTLTVARKPKDIVRVYLAILFGIGLAAFFIVPALLEQKYTNGYMFTKDVFYKQFPPLLSLLIPNFTNIAQLRMSEVPVQIGLFHTISYLMLLILVLKNRITKQIKSFSLLIVLLVPLVILFMQPITTVFWETISLIRQFQFPWRFVAIISLLTSLGAGIVMVYVKPIQKSVIYWSLIALVIVSTIYYWIPTQGYEKNDKSFYWDYPYTTNYFSEVNTVWMGKEPEDYPTNVVEIAGDTAVITSQSLTSIKHEFTVEASLPTTVIDRTFFFPGWKLYINGQEFSIQFQDPSYQGLITFKVPKGQSNVVVIFEQSKIQQLGNIISIGTVALLMSGFYLTRLKSFKWLL